MTYSNDNMENMKNGDDGDDDDDDNDDDDASNFIITHSSFLCINNLIHHSSSFIIIHYPSSSYCGWLRNPPVKIQ